MATPIDNQGMQDVAMTLENDGKFYWDYRDANLQAHSGDARLVILQHAKRMGLTSKYVIEGKHYEQLRRYFDERYDIQRDTSGDTASYARDKTWDFWKDGPYPERNGKSLLTTFSKVHVQKSPFDEVQPAPNQPFNFTSLPDGRVLITKGGREYVKGPHPKACHVKASTDRPLFGYRVGSEEDGFPNWSNWSADGTCSEDEYTVIGYRVRSRTSGSMPCIRTEFEHPINVQAGDTLVVETSVSTTRSIQENTMSQIINVTTQTLVNGKNIEGVEKAAIYDLIAQQEAAIAKLEAINTKPKMLVKEIAERQAGIDKLVAYLDSQASDVKVGSSE